MTVPSPEEIWTRAERWEAAGEDAALASALREGHALGWPGFLYGLALKLPLRVRDAELRALAADPLPLPRLAAARAYALQGRTPQAEATARAALARIDDDSVLDPDLVQELARLLRAAGRPLPTQPALALVARGAQARGL